MKNKCTGLIMLFHKLMRISVGTDLSRPAGISIAHKDVINRSLQIAHIPSIFSKSIITPFPFRAQNT